MLDPALQVLAVVSDDFTRLCFERCCLHPCGDGGHLDPLIHPSDVATVGGCLDVPVLISTVAGGLLSLALSCSESIMCGMARVLLKVAP